jgi:hypothetical protein
LGLKAGEVEWLSNHMGHTVDIHKEAYRLHESTIEMAKVSKLLLAIDNGMVGNFRGKSLDDIDIESKFDTNNPHVNICLKLKTKGTVPFQFKVPICDLLSFNIG